MDAFNTSFGVKIRWDWEPLYYHYSTLMGGFALHTDVKQLKMWPKSNRGKTTEAMSVVLISLNYISPAHLAVKKNLT